MLIDRIGIALKIHRSRRQRTAHMNRIFAKPRNKREAQLHRRLAFQRIYLPAPVELPPRRQLDGIGRARLHLLRLAHQVQHLRH